MENLYLNTEIKLSPEQQEKLFEGIDAKIDEKIYNMDTQYIVDEVREALDACDLYESMETYISDDFVHHSELREALERIGELEEALGRICSSLQGYKPEESDAEAWHDELGVGLRIGSLFLAGSPAVIEAKEGGIPKGHRGACYWLQAPHDSHMRT